MISFSQSVQITLIYYIMWYPDYQNKKLDLCMLKSFKGFIYASNKPLCGTPKINLGKN